MKCREASELMDRYIEDKLEEADKALLERHTAGCRQCRSELELLMRLRDERLRQRIKAPGDFTDNIMALLYRLPPEKRPGSGGVPEDRWRPVYRRLGYSLILTAGIIMFSLLVPGAGIQPEAISVRVQSGVEGSGPGYKSIFTDINAGIMGIFKDTHNTGPDNEGGNGQ
jgi:anti-sigma factor RsiW